MSYRIDDDENRIQDLTDKIDQLAIQTFSPEVVARNQSTRNTGIESGDSAALNAYPEWYPIRDFGTIGLLTLNITLNRTDSHVAKLTASGDIDFAFSLPPGTNKMMWFILDVTVDAIGGYTFNLLNNILPAGITIDNTANARTVIRFTTTDAGVTYYAENLTTGGGATNLLPLNNIWTGTNTWENTSTIKAGLQISDASNNIHSLLQGLAGIGTRLTLTGGEKLQVFDNITPILEINGSGLDLLTHGISNITIAGFIDTGGLGRGSISGDAGASAIRLATASGGKFIISDVITDIAEFTNLSGLKMLGTTHPINLNNNEINAAKEIEFNISNTFNPTVQTVIGFDFASKDLKYNVGLVTDIHSFRAAGEQLMVLNRFASNSGLLLVDNITSKIIEAQELFDLATFNNTSPSNGNIWLDSSTGNFQFRENGVTVGVGGLPNQIFQLNSNVTVIDTGAVGAINFTVDGTALGTITTGLGWVLENSDLILSSTSAAFKLANGSSLINTSSSITTLNVAAGNDLLFTEALSPYMTYDGGTNSLTLEPGNNIILNPNGEIDVEKDLDMSITARIDFNATQSSVGSAGFADDLPSKPDSYVIVKKNGVEFVMPLYNKS